jgi:lysophospholipase L1-like esterase
MVLRPTSSGAAATTRRPRRDPHRFTYAGRAFLVSACAFAVTVGAVAPARTAPARTPPTGVHARLRVLVVGESQAGTLAFGSPLGAEPHGLAARPDLVLWNSSLLACSISSVPVFILDTGELARNQCGGTGRWQQQWTTAVEVTKPDVVFLMAGARDLFDVAGQNGVIIHPGDAAWTDAYTADVRSLFRILGATGAPIVAVKPTCYGEDTLPGGEPQEPERLDPVRVHAVTAAWQSAARASRLQLLDLDAITCPGGVSDPAIRADGVHFSTAGADRVAPIVDAAVRAAFARGRPGRCSSPRKCAATSVRR